MSNKTNENNCFLNCVTQLLFHSASFKNEVLRLPLQSKNASTNPVEQIKVTILKIQNSASESEDGFIWILSTCVFLVAEYNFNLLMK